MTKFAAKHCENIVNPLMFFVITPRRESLKSAGLGEKAKKNKSSALKGKQYNTNETCIPSSVFFLFF